MTLRLRKPYVPLSTRVTQALDKLPKYPDLIADYFEAAGITGVPSEPCSCPVAKYLNQEAAPGRRKVLGYLGGELKDSSVKVVVGTTELSIRRRSHAVYIPVPPKVGNFIRAFDNGQFTHLEQKPHIVGGLINSDVYDIGATP